MSKHMDSLALQEKPLEQFSPKERFALLSGVLALLVVFGLATYIPAGPRSTYLQSRTQLNALQNELEMAKMMKIEQQMLLQSQEMLMETLEMRSASFDLFGFMSGLLDETGLNSDNRALLENLRNRRDLENQPAVDLTLSRVTLPEFLDLLHKVYASNNLVAVYKVDRLQPERTGKGLECKLTLVSLNPAE